MNKAFLHTIIIYTLTTCPYCKEAKKILTDNNIEFQEIVVDNFSPEIKSQLGKKSNTATGEIKTTFPHIVKSIGGCDDLKIFEKEGKLDSLKALN